MDRIIFEGKLAKQIHDLNFVAILEKDAMDRLYAEGHTTPITNGTFAEKMAVNLFIPHPARFQGVEEFFTSTGRNETYANFLFLSRPMKIDGKIWFVMDNGPTSKNITIAGCHFDDKSCHQMDMEFAKNDLIIHESYTTSLQSVSFTRVFYMPSEALAHHLVFADKPKRTQ
uniref:SERPIN domain-containing protein n=1 Tax=Caenorhabditis tropicalis TaxID=1561998 RepID=A0A1I7V2R7_9PELO